MLHKQSARVPGGGVAARILIVTAVFAVTVMYLTTTSRAEELPPREPLAKLPMQIDAWNGKREADLTPQVVEILGVDDYITRSYSQAGGGPIGLYIGYHTSQRQGDTIHSPLNCLPGAGWEPLDIQRTTIDVPSGAVNAPHRTIDVNRVIIGKGLDRALVLYWYQSHRRVVASEYWAKVYTVLDSVRYNRTDAAMVRIVVPFADGDSIDAADRQATAFAQALFPLLPRHLPS